MLLSLKSLELVLIQLVKVALTQTLLLVLSSYVCVKQMKLQSGDQVVPLFVLNNIEKMEALELTAKTEWI